MFKEKKTGSKGKLDKGALYAREKEFVTNLFNAAKGGNLETFQNLLKTTKTDSLSLPQYKDANGRTLLHFAVLYGHTELALFLLSQACGLDLNTPDATEDGETPLSQLCQSKHPETLAAVLSYAQNAQVKINLSSVNKESRSLIHNCVHSMDTQSIRVLLSFSSLGYPLGQNIKNIPSFNQTLDFKLEDSPLGCVLLYAALELGPAALEMSKFLINEIGPPVVDINQPNRIDAGTPVIMACNIGNFEAVKLLIAKGADLTLVSSEGWNILHFAADSGNEDIVQYLINECKDRININQYNNDGLTALAIAKSKGSDKVVAILKDITTVPEIDAFIAKKREIEKRQEEEQRQAGKRNKRSKDKTKDKPSFVSNVVVSDADKTKAQALKDEGNQFFAKGDWENAKSKYSEAIQLDPTNHVFYSNRSACCVKLKDAGNALEDAHRCRDMAPKWSKSYWRLGEALMLVGDEMEAVMAYWEGLQLEPGNIELQRGFAEATAIAKDKHQNQTPAK